MSNLTEIYEKDYHAWAMRNVELLRMGKFEKADIKHIIEELEDMGKQARRELVSHLVILLAHLLKWEFQPAMRSISWECSIDEQRDQIDILMEDTPSLKSTINEAIERAYPRAVRLAGKETKLPKDSFPVSCQYTLKQILDNEFYPQLNR